MSLFLLRLRATSKVFPKWKRKNSRRWFPQLTHKVGDAQPAFSLTLYLLVATLYSFCFLPPPSAVAVLERMLLLDPQSRATAAEALTLPYFTEFRETEEETEAQPYDHSLDNADLTLDQWKRKDEGGGGGGLLDWLWGNTAGKISGMITERCGGRQLEQMMFYWSASCRASVSRSHLHRDPDVQTRRARIQGNLTVSHEELAEQPGTEPNQHAFFISRKPLWSQELMNDHRLCSPSSATCCVFDYLAVCRRRRNNPDFLLSSLTSLQQLDFLSRVSTFYRAEDPNSHLYLI